jgi:hypothetical protein
MGMSFLLLSCGTQTIADKADSNPNKPSVPLKSVKSFSEKDATALVLLTIEHEDDEKHCMGSILESGKILTAAHCFTDLTSVDVSKRVSVRWIKLDELSSTFEANTQKISVTSIEQAPSKTEPFPDVALVSLPENEPLPPRRAVLATEKMDNSKRVLVPGPDRATLTDSVPKIDLLLGYLNSPEPDISYNPDVKEGFSGAPLLLVAPGYSGELGQFFKGEKLVIYAMHLGLKNSSGYGMIASQIQSFLAGPKLRL